MTMDKNFVDKFLLNSSNSSVSHVAETIKARSIPNTPYNLNIDVRSLQSDGASYLTGFHRSKSRIIKNCPEVRNIR